MADRTLTSTTEGVPAHERAARRLRRLARSVWKTVGGARGGLRSLERAVRLKLKRQKPGRLQPLLRPDDPADYARWIAANDVLSGLDRSLIRRHIAAFAGRPRFSVVVAVEAGADPGAVERTVRSVRDQLYGAFELIVAGGDLPPAPGVVSVAAPAGQALAAGVAAATGARRGPLSPGDRLAELYLVAERILAVPEAVIVYSDEDEEDAGGARRNPFFKPDFDPELMLGQDLLGRLAAYRAESVRAAGGPATGADAERDLAFRVIEAAAGAPVVHVPFVLCHRGGAAPAPPKAETLATIAGHLARTGRAATVEADPRFGIRIRRTLPPPPPLVSIVIPTKNRHELIGPCLAGLFERTDYAPLEIVIVDNGSDEAEALAVLAEARKRPNVTVIEDRGGFNFSRLVNRGVAVSTGSVVVLLNNDIDVIHPDWLTELVSQAVRPEVGAVGPMLYYADDTIQHAGVVLGVNGRAAHEHKRTPRGAAGYRGRLLVARETSCVTGACLVTRRDIYDALGGLNERDFAVGFNDVDYCIRLRVAGYRVLWTPHAELYHYESVSRGHALATAEGTERHARESGNLRGQWWQLLSADPFYNPNFALEAVPHRLAWTSRARKPWIERATARQGPQPGVSPDPATLDWRDGDAGAV